MNKLTVAVAVLGVALALSACGTSEVSGEAAQTVTGQVADYTGPAGALEAADGFTDSPVSIGAGTIDADGSFTFELDSTVPESVLNPLDFTNGCDGIKVSNPNAKGFAVPRLKVISEGGIVGSLELASADSSVATSYKSTVRFYVDQDTTIRGTCEFSNEFGSSKQSANLNLKRGWNVISSDTSETDNSYEVNLYNGVASGVRWVYY